MSIEEIEDESNQHGCCENNKLSICLGFLVILLITVICTLMFLFFGYVSFTATPTECTNSACLKSSVEISNYIDDSIDPCDDFYSFVCSKFEKSAYENQIQNILNAEKEKIKRRLDTLIVEPSSNDDSQPVKIQKLYFQSCLNGEETDKDSDQTLLKKLLEISEWPFLRKYTNWSDESFNWMNVMIKARNSGLPFEWFLKVDLYKAEEYELKLSQPENCGDTLTDAYFAMQRDILEKLTRPGIDTISEFAHLEKFERKLNAICANTTDVEISLRRMFHLRLDNIKTVYFLKSITGLTHKWRFDSILAFNVDYIFELNRLLNETSNKIQANYILWKMIQHFAPFLSQSIRERYMEYIIEISGEDIGRFQFCLDDTKSRFKFISEITYLKEYLESLIQENAEELVTTVNEQLLNYIENIVWRNNRTRESHLDFYGNLEQVIGGPDEMLEDHYLSEHFNYGKFVFLSDNIIQMITDWSRSNFISKMRMIGQPTTTDLTSVFEANSQLVVVLDEDKQQLILPGFIFDSFLYKNERPQYLNFAGLGITVATELMKGLNLMNKDRPETFVGFERSKTCLTQNLEKLDKKLEALHVVSVNYDFILGHLIAYKAYQTYVENNGEEEQLMNLNYSPNQLFWIKSGLNWCYKALPEEENEEMDKILKYRLIQTIRNSPDFSTDFNCSEEANMNPKNKCILF